MLNTLYFAKPRYFLLLLASSLAVNTLALALPLITMQVYDRILSNRSSDTLIVLASGVMLAAIIEFILRSCRSIVTGQNGANFEHEASTKALKQLLEAEPRNFGNTAPAILAQDISSAGRLKDYYGGQMMVTLLIDAPFIIIFLALEAYLAGWLAVVPASVLLIFLYISKRQGNVLRDLMEKREKMDNARYSFITQSLQVVHSIKGLCLEAQMARHFEEVQRESGPVNYRIACLHGQASSLSYAFSQIMTIAVLCAGAPLAIAGHISIGVLIACVLLSGQVMQPLQRGLAMWVRFQDIILAKERLQKLFSYSQRGFLKLNPEVNNTGEVKLRNVRFSYGNDKFILDGVNLGISAGESVAFSGVAGSGKTSLLELIAGIYAPDRGEIFAGELETYKIPVSERSRYIAYLPMHGMILRGSIMDNLTGFNPPDRAAARLVADQLGIEEAVSLLPAGYDTPLEGHMTDVISPGLKQRISIARALLHKPKLILYDNADHGMDHESYTHIFELMVRLKGKATLIIVSEDRNILSLADNIYELRHGQLVKNEEPVSFANIRRFVTGET